MYVPTGIYNGFLSTLSLRRATNCHVIFDLAVQFLSTLSLRRATAATQRLFLCYPISIHALLAESDPTGTDSVSRHPDFYPRSPCGERRVHCAGIRLSAGFLSTLSLRRATTHQTGNNIDAGISIHALLAESDMPMTERMVEGFISIHALLAESDMICGRSATICAIFLSTLSLRRATIWRSTRLLSMIFLSTLSLRRATVQRGPWPHQRGHFYPRSPCGERRTQSQIDARVIPISIHALLAGSDYCHAAGGGKDYDFYPRSPCGERPLQGRNRRN